MVRVSFEEFFHFFIGIFTLEVGYDLFIADCLQALHSWQIALIQETLHLFDKSAFEHFFDPGVDELIGRLLVSPQSKHQQRMAYRLLDIAFGLGFSGFIVNFQRSDQISNRIWMKFLCLLWIDFSQFAIEKSGFLSFFLFKLSSQIQVWWTLWHRKIFVNRIDIKSSPPYDKWHFSSGEYLIHNMI